MVDWVENYQFHLLHIRITVFCQILLVHKDIDNFCHKIVAGLAFVVFLLDAALQSHREICEYRSINHSCLLDVPSCLIHLLRVVFGRYDAYKIGCHHCILGGKGYSKLAIAIQILCCDMRAHGNHYFLHVPLSTPRSIHCVWGAILIICAYNQHGHRYYPWFWCKTFHIRNLLNYQFFYDIYYLSFP